MNFFVRNPNSHNNRNGSEDPSRWAFEEFKSEYELKEFMGEGSFGTVHKARSRIRSRSRGGIFSIKQPLYACKTIPKSKVDDILMLKEECSNLEDARGHSHLLSFEKTFEDDKEVHIITELLEGGELYEAIIELKKRRAYFPEEDTAWMVRNILDGLSYCHDVIGIVHRDLKASNFMFKRRIELPGKDKKSKANKTRNSQNLRDIKIIDFGLSTKIDSETGKVKGCLGTPYYVAPEVLTEESYDSKCDVWSIGVIAYLILSRQLPFQGKDEEETISFLMEADNYKPKYDSTRWRSLDPQAIDFCNSLLQIDPSKRPTVREAMSHPWIVKHCGRPPPQRPQINMDHSIKVDPTEDQLLVSSSQTFDSLRSDSTQDTTHKIILFDGIPEEENQTHSGSGSSRKHRKKNPLQRLLSTNKTHRSDAETIRSINKKESKSTRTRQKTQKTLILEE